MLGGFIASSWGPVRIVGSRRARCPRHGPQRQVSRRRARVLATTTPRVLTEGDIVAVVRGSGSVRAEVGVVTGTDSSGKNVDFVLLKAFVPELYVNEGGEETFCRSDQVRRVPAEWVEEQRGWIVLDADVAEAKDAIAAAVDVPVVEVRRAAPSAPKKITPREPFRPTRAQAFIGAALSIPVSAIAYAVFAGERAAFAKEATEGALLDVALVGAAAVSILALIVGAALFLYGVNLPPDEESTE